MPLVVRLSLSGTVVKVNSRDILPHCYLFHNGRQIKYSQTIETILVVNGYNIIALLRLSVFLVVARDGQP